MPKIRTTRKVTRGTRWRFSLRTLLLLTMIAGPAIGLGGPPLYRLAKEFAQPPQQTATSGLIGEVVICVLEPWPLEPVEDPAPQIEVEQSAPVP